MPRLKGARFFTGVASPETAERSSFNCCWIVERCCSNSVCKAAFDLAMNKPTRENVVRSAAISYNSNFIDKITDSHFQSLRDLHERTHRNIQIAAFHFANEVVMQFSAFGELFLG